MKKRGIQTKLGAAAVAAVIGLSSVTAGSAAEPASHEAARLAAPLSRDDSRAQSDAPSDMREVPIPPPHAVPRRAKPSDPHLVAFDLRSRRTEVLRPERNAPAAPDEVVNDELAPALEGFTGSVPVAPEAPQTSAGDLATPYKIYGPDNRTRISPTTHYPARTRAFLQMQFPDSRGSWTCSGTLIGPRHLITNGHCVHSKKLGGYATSIRVTPGLDGSYAPYGSATGVVVGVPRGWTQDQKIDYDYALVRLDRDIGYSTG